MERGSVSLIDTQDIPEEGDAPVSVEDEVNRPISKEELEYTRGLLLSTRLRGSVNEAILIRPSEVQKRELRAIISDEEVIRHVRAQRAITARYRLLQLRRAHEHRRESERRYRVATSTSHGGGGRAQHTSRDPEKVQADGVDSRQFRRRMSYGPGYQPPLRADVSGSAFTNLAPKNQYRRALSSLERKELEELWRQEMDEEARTDNYLDGDVSRDLLNGLFRFQDEQGDGTTMQTNETRLALPARPEFNSDMSRTDSDNDADADVNGAGVFARYTRNLPLLFSVLGILIVIVIVFIFKFCNKKGVVDGSRGKKGGSRVD